MGETNNMFSRNFPFFWFYISKKFEEKKMYDKYMKIDMYWKFSYLIFF